MIDMNPGTQAQDHMDEQRVFAALAELQEAEVIQISLERLLLEAGSVNKIEYGSRETFLRYASKRSNAVAIFFQVDMHKKLFG